MCRSLHRNLFLCVMACLLLVPIAAYADVYAEYEVAGAENGYHTNTIINSRRTDHFIMRFGNQPREGFMQEHVVQGQLQFLEHVYDQWQLLGLHPLGGLDTTKYKNIIKPHATWDWDSSGTAVGFTEGPMMIPGAHIPANALNYTTGNGCTPHEFGHGWQNQHVDGSSGGLPPCEPQGFTESLANWVMSLYLGDYPSAWPAVGATYGHAMIGYNCMSIFNYFMEAPGYGPTFINKLIFDPNLNSGGNYAGDDIVAKAIRCDTSGAVDHAGTIRDGLGMMNAKMLDMDFWNHRVDRAYAYDKDTDWSYYQWTRIPMVKQPGVAGPYYRPEWLCTPQQSSNSYIPLTITASGSPRTITCDFRPTPDAVRGSIFRACFVAFNNNKEARYSAVWNVGEKSFALADDENAVYLAVYAIPKAWNSGYMSNDYIADNIAMFPYRVKLTGATPKPYQWADPGVAYHLHSNGGGYVADTATVDGSAYVGPNARVLGTAKVYGNSRIEDYAVVSGNATIGRSGQSDNPVISGHAYVTDNALVYGHGKVRDYGWVWNSAAVYDNAIVMAHTMLSGGSAFGCAVLNQCPMRDTGLSFNGTFSGCVIKGGDNSGGGTFTTGVYAKWQNSYTGDNKYQYLGYNFEKKSAVFAMDQYGLNHSFLMNDPQVVSDSVNSVTTNVLNLDGASQYVELKPDAVDFADMSITAWVKWSGTANDQRILSAGDGNTKYMYLTPKDATTSKLRLVISDGTTTQYIDGAAALSANTWTHVAVTFSGNTGTLYVNGTQVGQNTGLTIDPDQLHAALMEDANYLGRGNAGNYFQGRIDEFRVYNKALSAAEVTTVKGEVTAGAAAAADTAAPTPSTSTWLVSPVASGDGAITMTATEGTDAGGNGVLYYFRCVTDATHDSGWISEPKFTDCKCAPGTSYTYAVKMKDKLGNTGTESSQLAATAQATDTTAPTPNPPTFSSAPLGSGTTSISMTATKATDADELVMYKFTRVGTAVTSGWSSSRTWTDTGLTSGSSYSYTLQVKDSHGNTTSTTTSASVVARDDTPPAFDTLRRLQWETEPYVRLDKTIRMSVRAQAETAVDYYFECVENTAINSGWISAKDWVTPAMADGTWTFRFKLRDRSAQLNQTAWSNTAQTKVLTTNCYHDYSLTQLAGLPDSTLARFTGKVTAVNAGSYVVSTTDGLTSITVVPHSYNYKTDATLLNKNVTVKGHVWTYNSTGKEITYAYVLGNPASGKLEFENGDPIGASTNEASPYYDPNASFSEGVNVWYTNGDAVEFPNVTAATELTICYGFGGIGSMSLYVNGTHVRDLSFPSTGGNNKYGYKVETGLNIPAGATVKFQSDAGDIAPCLDFVVVGPTYTVSGNVTDASQGNAPVSGAKVYFSPSTGAIANYVYTAVTDASGNYSVRLPAGTWYAAAAFSTEVRIKSSGEQTVTTGPDKTGLNFSINWDTARSGKIEAETGKCLGIASAVNDPNASGGMVITGTYEIGGGVEFSNIAAATQMTVSYGYSGGTFSVYVNGVHATDMDLPWHAGTYGETTVAVTIPDHATVRFQHDTGDRDTQFDYIVFGGVTNYTITASAGTGGTITPSGAVSVTSGTNKTFTIAPSAGYAIADVTVDGASQGAISTYTFNNVTANHTISATFAASGYTITASAGSGGSISPSGAVSVTSGGSKTFTITPNASYTIAGVTVDGSSVGAVTSYTFSNVTANHTIAATFTFNSNRNVPQTANLIKSAITETFPTSGSTGNWASYLPSGETFTTIGTPTVNTISGVKWAMNLNADMDGFDCGTYSSSIPCNGASIVAAVKPVRIGSDDNWQSVVDVFYDRLVLGVTKGTGRVCVRRNGSLDWSTATIPDGQTTVLSMVVQPDGTYKVWANGTEVMNNTTTSAMTSLVPNVPGPYANHINVGRNNPDGWTTYNGNIGDFFLYKVALTDTERLQLETDINNKLTGLYTITASAGTGGSITPSGAVSVAIGANQAFTITPNAGYSIADVTVDGVSQGAISSYTFTNVTATHTISATFSAITYTITASAGTGGSISPNGAVSVNSGASRSFTITPTAGYAVADVTVDGASVGAVTSYTFTNVTANHSISAQFISTGRNIPQVSKLLFCCDTNSFPASGNTGAWAAYYPIGSSFTAMATPTVQTISGVKWESNVRTDYDGYDCGAYSSSIPCSGASIVVAVKPIRTGTDDNWRSVVDVFYDRLVLGVMNGTGKVCVRRNGSLDWSTATIPDGQVTVMSLVAQADGTYKVWANGTEIMNNTTTSALTSLVPNVPGPYANHINIGRNNPDGWTTYHGNIGDVFLYKTALTDTERQQLEADLTAKFATVTYTLTASADTGGSITPSGAVSVNSGSNQTFTITPNTGYAIANVAVDGVNQGAISTYTFTNVTASHTISATFSAITYTINASAGANGTISPSGTVSVNYGANQQFLMTPSTGYKITAVTVDGSSVGAVSSYTFTNVTAGHTISVTFEPDLPTPLVALDVASLPTGNLTTWSNTGSLTGSFSNDGTTVTVGTVGSKKCVTFSGSARMKGNFSAPAGVTGNGDFTVSIWAYNPAFAAEECMLAWSKRGGGNGTNAQINFGNSTVYGAVAHWGNAYDMGFTTQPTASAWHHICVTFDGATEKVYVDSVLRTTETKTLSIYSGYLMYLGCAYTYSAPNYSPTLYYSGSMGPVRMYDQALTASEVTALYGQSW